MPESVQRWAAVQERAGPASGGTPAHVAIIMDGNRRWARQHGLPDVVGHRRGASTLEALLPVVARTGVETLTLFGFSASNWQRQPGEVRHLMQIAETAIRRFLPDCIREGVAVEVIGRRDRLPGSLVAAIEEAERTSAGGARLLRIACDYSAREAILRTARGLDRAVDADGFTACLGRGGDVDLLIRTGRGQRLSDFLLWECAFAELYFPDLYWPEFTGEHFLEALAWYGQRDRRFGG